MANDLKETSKISLLFNKTERKCESSQTTGGMLIGDILVGISTSGKYGRKKSIISVNSDYVRNTTRDLSMQKTIVDKLREPPGSKWSSIREIFHPAAETIEKDAMLTILKNKNLKRDVETFLDKYLKETEKTNDSDETELDEASDKFEFIDLSSSTSTIADIEGRAVTEEPSDNVLKQTRTKVSLTESCPCTSTQTPHKFFRKRNQSAKSLVEYLREFKLKNRSNKQKTTRFYHFSQQILTRLRTLLRRNNTKTR